MNKYLIRKVLFPAYRAIKRDGLLDRLDEMHRVEKLDPDEHREGGDPVADANDEGIDGRFALVLHLR